MIKKLVLAVPFAALSLLTLAAGTVATSDTAEAGNCRRVGSGHRFDCTTMSTPKPDRPNQQQK